MKQRLDINELQPAGYNAVIGLEKYLATTAIDHKLKHMIKVRASQINGCAYCIQMHTTDARKLGEPEQRIYALSAWRESPLFSDEEKAVFAMTDEITLIANNGLTENTYQEVKKYYDENMIAQLIMLIVTINAWNRIAVSTRMFHPVENNK